MRHNRRRFAADLLPVLLPALCALVLWGCASIGTPSGGQRDEIPPRFVRANPMPGARNFKGDRIVLRFDELINIKDPMTNVVISPPSSTPPRVTSQGRNVIVTFSDTLQSNTTYTIDFGSAIEDNNEGNKLENFSYTFSTGDHIDSLRIAGMVLSSSGLEPMQRKLVGVHSNTADSAFTKLKFDRVARTDDRGRFSIEGLAPGQYRLFALDDPDGNFRYSSPEEEIAFYDLLISPSVSETETVDSIFDLKREVLDTVVTRRRPIYLPNDILLRSFLTDRKQQYIAANSRRDSTRIELTFGAPQAQMPDFSIVGAPDLKEWFVAEHSKTNDTITLWLSRPSLIKTDTLRLAINYQRLDSLSNYTAYADTIRFVTDRPRVPKNKSKAKKEEADTLPAPTPLMSMTFISRTPLDIDMPIIFETEQPLSRLDTTAFHLEQRRDTIWVPIATTAPRMLDSINPRRFAINLPRTYGAEYKLTIDSLAMTGLYGLNTGPAESAFKVKEENEYSSLQMNIEGIPHGLSSFAELLTAGDTPARRTPVVNNVATFKDLIPGKYYLRLYLDFNGNGKYDTGDYHVGRQPDQAFYYPKLINIKKNWEKSESWNILELPMDKQKPEKLLKNKPERRKHERNNTTGEEDEEDEENSFYQNPNRNNNNRNNPAGSNSPLNRLSL